MSLIRAPALVEALVSRANLYAAEDAHDISWGMTVAISADLCSMSVADEMETVGLLQ